MISDYLLDEDGDLKIENGDFVFGDATLDNQRLLLQADFGELRMTPLRCVAIRQFQDDEAPRDMLRQINKEFVNDGMTVQKVEIIKGELNIEASYE